jgi:hypothetical protein
MKQESARPTEDKKDGVFYGGNLNLKENMKAGYGVIVKQDDGNYVDKGPDYVESLADYDTKSRYTKAEYKEKFQNMFSGRRDT